MAEFPFYHRRAFAKELSLSAAWLRQEERPVVYDLGANVGFIATHLAQILATHAPQIYAFEPAPATFARLERSVRRLGLGHSVHPVAAAIVEEARPVRIAVSARNSMLSHVVPREPDLAQVNGYAFAAGITLDTFSAALDISPTFIKMDVEGSEVAALRGARRLLAAESRPALLFEHNPKTLSENGLTTEALAAELSRYAFYYVDDLDGQVLPFGSAVPELGGIDWTCNLFAAPLNDALEARWASTLRDARAMLADGAPTPAG
jgi:FkbM family methyltransferase